MIFEVIFLNYDILDISYDILDISYGFMISDTFSLFNPFWKLLLKSLII